MNLLMKGAALAAPFSCTTKYSGNVYSPRPPDIGVRLLTITLDSTNCPSILRQNSPAATTDNSKGCSNGAFRCSVSAQRNHALDRKNRSLAVPATGS